MNRLSYLFSRRANSFIFKLELLKKSQSGLGTSLVGSSPSSLLRSGSVSAKELESVRRIDGSASGSLYPVPGREISESGSGDGHALDPGKKDS